MALPTVNAFLLRFPEFGQQSLSVIEGVLTEASRTLSSDVWGDVHPEGVSYLAAHLLATRTMQIGLQVGTISGSPLGSGFDSTLYGQEYKRLLNSLALSGFAF